MAAAIRTQVYLTRNQRSALDARARAENITLAHVIRDAVDHYLAEDLDPAARDRALEETFGSLPEIADRVPSRDEWSHRSATRAGTRDQNVG